MPLLHLHLRPTSSNLAACLQQSPRSFLSFTNYSIGLGPRSSFHSWLGLQAKLTCKHYRLTDVDYWPLSLSRKDLFLRLISHRTPHHVSLSSLMLLVWFFHYNYLGRDPRPCFFYQPPCLQMKTLTLRAFTVIYLLITLEVWASLLTQMVTILPAKWETWIQFLGWEDSPRQGNGYPLHYSCLENSMDRGAWWVTVHGVAKCQAWSSNIHFYFSGCLSFQPRSFLRGPFPDICWLWDHHLDIAHGPKFPHSNPSFPNWIPPVFISI